MKKLIFLSVLFFNTASPMYDQGGKLKYDQIKVTNKSPIPLDLTWVEVRRPQGNPTEITKHINPGETITVKIGEVGGYYPNDPAKITYNPVPGNEAFKQSFIIDLPNTKEFTFTAVKLAEILNNIWVPVMFQSDDQGNFGSYQYMNISDWQHWQKTISQGAGAPRKAK